jgi:hypothetical protein
MQRLILLARHARPNVTLTVYDTKGYVWNFIANNNRQPYLAATMDGRLRKIVQSAGRAMKKFWLFLKPPMTLKEARKKGLGYLILIIVIYLIRDTILYIILPLTACEVIF